MYKLLDTVALTHDIPAAGLCKDDLGASWKCSLQMLSRSSSWLRPGVPKRFSRSALRASAKSVTTISSQCARSNEPTANLSFRRTSAAQLRRRGATRRLG